MYPSLTSLVSLLWEQLWGFGPFVPRRMESPSANPFNFPAITSFVCVREVGPWQDHKKFTLYSPREVGVLRAHTAQSRGPLKCHRVYKASFSRLKKSQQIMELHSSFQIRKPGTRDHKGLIQSHTALTLTHLLIPWWMRWVLGSGPAQDQSCSSS